MMQETQFSGVGMSTVSLNWQLQMSANYSKWVRLVTYLIYNSMHVLPMDLGLAGQLAHCTLQLVGQPD